MAKAVVLLFLLDSVPDFNNVMNAALHKLAPGAIIAACNPAITSPVLEVIAKKLNLGADSVEKLQYIEPFPKPYNHKFQELSPDLLNNIGYVDTSNEHSNEFSMKKNLLEYNYIEKASNKNEDITAVTDLNTGNASKAENPDSLPFLAAIFETVGNVTAQTCGGVLLAPEWVLTAASCVNVLAPFYSNSSNETTENYYSVVIGAKNPLKDGSVHQVSKIYLYPVPNSSSKLLNTEHGLTRHWFNSTVGPGDKATAPSLALLKIEPGVEGEMLHIMENKTDWDGVTGRLYGWTLEQKESGFVMMATSLPTKQLSPAECKTAYGIMEDNLTLCLSVNETSSKATRLISGCPLVVVQNGRLELLAVALTDGTEPLLARLLSAHQYWLRNLVLVEKLR